MKSVFLPSPPENLSLKKIATKISFSQNSFIFQKRQPDIPIPSQSWYKFMVVLLLNYVAAAAVSNSLEWGVLIFRVMVHNRNKEHLGWENRSVGPKHGPFIILDDPLLSAWGRVGNYFFSQMYIFTHFCGLVKRGCVTLNLLFLAK